MPKKKDKQSSAADETVPRRKARTNKPKDPVKSKAGKASAAARKAKRESDAPVTRQCSARRTNGEPCRNSAIRGGTVCARHGGSAPQVRAKANQRLIEMVMPAMRELRKIIDDPNALDADKLKAINMVLNRTGYNERHEIDLGLRTPTPFDHLATNGFVTVVRGEENIVDADEHQTLPSGDGGGLTDDELDALLTHRERARAREAQSRLDNSDHDVVPGDVVTWEEANLFGYERTRDERYRNSGASELDPRGTQPEGDPWAAYEARVREGLE